MITCPTELCLMARVLRCHTEWKTKHDLSNFRFNFHNLKNNACDTELVRYETLIRTHQRVPFVLRQNSLLRYESHTGTKFRCVVQACTRACTSTKYFPSLPRNRDISCRGLFLSLRIYFCYLLICSCSHIPIKWNMVKRNNENICTFNYLRKYLYRLPFRCEIWWKIHILFDEVMVC